MDQDMELAGSELPSEIICFQILPRLPSKSLMRFKCVGKSWSSLVRSPSFVDAHQSFHRSKLTHLLLTTWDKATRQQHFLSVQINQEGISTAATHLLNLPTSSYDQHLYNVESINGLVFLYPSNVVFLHHNQANRDSLFRMFNPSTREFIVLPHAFPTCCHSAHSTHHFGFSPLTNEYKVLQVQRFRPHDSITSAITYMLKIFKLGTSLWRCIELDLNDLPFDPFKCPFHWRSVSVNGAIHWMHDTQNILVAFDIGDEKFRVIPLPHNYNCAIKFNFPHGNIVDMFGCLALIGDQQLLQENMMGLWILKDYENQVWVKETFKFPFVWIELGYPVPFCSIHIAELLLQSSKLSRQHPNRVRLHLYNMKSKIFTGSEIVLPSEWRFRYDTRLKLLASYDDSIVPLRRNGLFVHQVLLQRLGLKLEAFDSPTCF